MAAVMEIHLVCDRLLDMEPAMQVLNTSGLKAVVKEQFYIDDWTWENEHRLDKMSNLDEFLTQGKIITIKFVTNKYKDMGITIERGYNQYIYNMWINTEGFPYLDVNQVYAGNADHFAQVYQILGKIIRSQRITFTLVAIGVESIFEYRGNIADTMQSAKNITTWIFDKSIGDKICLTGYAEKTIPDFNIVAFERKLN